LNEKSHVAKGRPIVKKELVNKDNI